jgi:peptidoglycan/xylan/chitin deacetylase (PgdA/CDA1 family)
VSGATVSVTFDNLGEVTALARGEWPPDEPLGRHFSVTRALPRILELLAGSGLRATFFVEGLNAELYPDTLRGLAAAGHEVAYHGWRHEPWAELDPARERELLERGLRHLEALDLRPVGFRPPGGELTAASVGLLRRLGFAYCSPAGDVVEAVDGLAVLPFRWRLVDAVHYLPRFAGLRERELGARDPLPPARLRAAFARALDGAARADAFVALVFHPFLADAGERFDVLRAALERVRALVDAGALRCAPCRDVAAAVRAQAS